MDYNKEATAGRASEGSKGVNVTFVLYISTQFYNTVVSR